MRGFAMSNKEDKCPIGQEHNKESQENDSLDGNCIITPDVGLQISAPVNANEIFKTMLSSFKNRSKWDSGLFKEIKTISNTKVGEVGQKFLEELCKAHHIPVSPPTDAKGKQVKRGAWDILIDGCYLEIKTATEDVSGNFQFNHIRLHREYDGVICLGVSPGNLYFSAWSKADISTSKAGHLVSMEKNANASYKLTKKTTELIEISKFQEKILEFTSSCEKIIGQKKTKNEKISVAKNKKEINSG